MDQRDQRIYDILGKTVQVTVDRPKGYVHHGLVYPVNYGYIPGITAGDGEEQDAYILGIDTPVATFEGQVIGAIRRTNDVEDKWVVAPEGVELHQGQIAEATQFQEQFFQGYIISLLRKSCGILPWRLRGNQKEYLLVFETFSQCWSLPKGHMEAGETETETALRELFEETGLTADIDNSRRAVIEYPVGPKSRKQVVFFPGQVTGEPRPRPGETEQFRWVTAGELKDHLFPDTVQACQALL